MHSNGGRARSRDARLPAADLLTADAEMSFAMASVPQQREGEAAAHLAPRHQMNPQHRIRLEKARHRELACIDRFEAQGVDEAKHDLFPLWLVAGDEHDGLSRCKDGIGHD